MFILELHRDLRIVGCMVLRSLEGVLAGAGRCLLLRTLALALRRPNVAAASHVTLLLFFSVRPLVLAAEGGGVQGGLPAISPPNSIVTRLETGLTRHRDDRVLRAVRSHGLDLQRVL